MVERAAFWAMVLFACGGVVLGVAHLLGRTDRTAWRRYVLEAAFIALVLVPAGAGATWWRIAMLVLGLVATVELARCAPGRLPRIAAALSLAVIPAVVLLPPQAIWGAALIGPAVLLALLVHRGSVPPSVLGATPLLYPALGAAALATIPSFGNTFGHAGFLFAVLEMNDSFAYLVGRFFGRRRVFGALSPNKTLEGTLAGLVAAATTGGIGHFAFDGARWTETALLGLGIGVVGVIGDISASALKRRLGRRDFADWVPDHGSLLDAYDSLLFAGPIWCGVLALTR